MKSLILLFTVFMICFVVAVVHADIYISSSGAGTQDGSSCANARSASWFNASDNWGGGGTDIDPGDTVRLCGTFVGAANSTILTIQGSGTSGNVITILFEDNAKLQAPYFSTGGAINGGNHDYITIDGGTNGIIENTDNGSVASGKTYHAYSTGIYFNGGNNNLDIKNLTIQNMFINTGGDDSEATDNNGLETACIFVNDDSSWSNISIHDNTLNNARWGMFLSFEGCTCSDLEIYDNYLEDHCWFFAIAGGSADNSVITGVAIYENEYADWSLWQYPTSSYHTNGLIIYANGSTNCSYGGAFYNNYAHGNLGIGSPSGYIITGCGGGNFLIYNNLFVCNDNPVSGMACVAIYNAGGCESSGGAQPINTTVLNNTFIGDADTSKVSWQGLAIRNARIGMSMTIKNNIFVDYHHPLEDVDTDFPAFSENGGGSGVTDYNLYYGHTYPVAVDWQTNKTFTEWQAAPYNQEAHGVEGDPLLTALYKLSVGSPAIGVGVDLSAIFTTDKDNVTRAVPWDMGAYEYGAAIIMENLVITGGVVIN